MPSQELLNTLGRYARALESRGITVSFLVLFGSHARHEATEESDVDVVVVSPRFDQERTRSLQVVLWQVAAEIDVRIEPIPCGHAEWQNPDGSRPILDSVHWDGQYIRVDAVA